jgi:glutathione S-transferase
VYKLYWSRQSASLAPELVLAEAGLPFEKIMVDIKRGANFDPAYRAINPAAVVPTLVTPEGEVITETAAIVLSLCERHGLDLAPAPGQPQRAGFLRWLFHLSNVIQTTYKRYYRPQRISPDPAAAPGIKALAVEAQSAQWQIVEDHLAAGGPFILGERFSAADLYLAMLVTWFPDEQGLMDRMPALRRCFEQITARPVVRRIMADYGDIPADWASEAPR